MVRKALLACGILSSLVYLSRDLAALLSYQGYDFAAQTISELSAIGVPSRGIDIGLGYAYDVLTIAFGAGVWMSAGDKRSLRVVGALLIAASIYGAFWPPMHMRGVGTTLTDTLHIVWTVGWLLLTMAAMAIAGATFGKPFLYYTVATIAVMLLFGALTGTQGPHIQQDVPTPWAGITERVNIGAFLLWAAVLAVELWPRSLGRPEPVRRSHT